MPPRSISLLLKSANFVLPYIGKPGALPVSPRSISLLLKSANFALPHIGKLGIFRDVPSFKGLNQFNLFEVAGF